MISGFLHLAVLDPAISDSTEIKDELTELLHSIRRDKNIVFCNFEHNKNKPLDKCCDILRTALFHCGLVKQIEKPSGDDLNTVIESLPKNLPLLVLSQREINLSAYPNVKNIRAYPENSGFNCFLKRAPLKISQNALIEELLKTLDVLKFAGLTGPIEIDFLDPYLNKNFVFQIIKQRLINYATIRFHFCRPGKLNKDYINKEFLGVHLRGKFRDLKIMNKIYEEFNKWLTDEVQKTIKAFNVELKSCDPNGFKSLQGKTSNLLFYYYNIRKEKYQNQTDQDASESAFSDLQGIWHHRAFKIKSGETGIYSNSYESAHSFIYPGSKIHSASEPLHFRLISNKDFGSVLKQDVWDSPYIMDINGPIK